MENLKSEAKKFILDNSPEWLEAVENGYDLRMEESEWLEWMVRYRTADLPSPVCNGEGRVPASFAATTLSPSVRFVADLKL